MIRPESMGAAGAHGVQRHQHRMAPRRQRTTLFAFIAKIQARYGADTAAADALVMQMLGEQRVTFYQACRGRKAPTSLGAPGSDGLTGETPGEPVHHPGRAALRPGQSSTKKPKGV
jgi:hypothetical protein